MKSHRLVFALMLIVIAAVLGASPRLSQPAQALSSDIVISQVYGGGGNTGATYTHDFIELFNRGASSVNLAGWSLQYASPTGSGNFGSTATQITELSGSLAAGQYLLVQEASNAAVGIALPTPDVTDTSPIAMGAGGGKVALVNTTTPLGCNGNANVCSAGALATIVDLVGYGNANYFEGSAAAPTPSAILAVYRGSNGCTETDQNGSDFGPAAAAPSPRNTASTLNICPAGDAGPSVISTSPVDNATNVAVDKVISITFSEAVTITGTIPIDCSITGTINATPTTGDYLTFQLQHDDFAFGETCSVTIDDLQVADNDTDDPPDNMAADYQFDFTVFAPPPPPCTVAAIITPIHDVQGNGTSSPLVSTSVTIEGIVVGDFQNVTALGDLNGFHVQEEDAEVDADPATSEGVFVYEGNGAPLATVAIGDKVRVTGTVTEFVSGSITLTEIITPAIEVCSTGNTVPAATVVTLPMPSTSHFERYEGMLATFSQKLYATEHFTLGRFGEVVLSSGDRLRIPTDAVEPGAPAVAYKATNDLNRIVLDDAFTTQNPDPIIHPAPGLTAANTVRGGDSVTGLTGIMDQGFGLYRIQPASGVAFTAENPRPAGAPSVGGSLTVAGMNLLNYYDTFTGCTAGAGGAATDCRGAENATEFGRQVPKTVAAILEISPDVLGVNEIENDGYADGASAIDHLVDALNAASTPGTYAYIDVDTETGLTNALGTDGIKVGLIYNTGSVAPTGTTAALNTPAFVNGGDASPRNRASLLQAFTEIASGEVFLVNVNHLKSKGSPCTLPDQGDGQGNCNQVRLNAANELTAWIATNPTGTSDPDILLIGDYNSYRKEDPVDAIQAAGYDNLVETLLGDDAYSYVFSGEWGYLDYAFASSSMAAQISGVAEYHINADEPTVLDYNTNFKNANLQNILFAPDEFRMSDHDPVVVGLDLADTIAPDTTILTNPPDPSTSADATFTFSSDDPNASFECSLDGSSFAACTSPKNYTGLAESPHTFEVRAVDAALNVDPTPAQYTWTIDLPAPSAMVFVAAGNGTADNDTEPDVPFTKGDVVKWDGTAWTMFFDGSANGVSASGDIIALAVDNPAAGRLYLTWRLGTTLPVLGKVQPQDISYFDGATFSRFFEGKDVGLTLVSERINGLDVLPGSASPINDGNCQAYLLISTMAGGTVRNGNDPVIRFTGEDVLGFCMTSDGANTTGLWHVAFEGESNGLKKNSTLGLAASANAGTLYFTTKNTFPAGVNKILPFVQPSGPLGAPVFNTAAAGISSLVDSIDIAEPADPDICSAGDTLASTDC